MTDQEKEQVSSCVDSEGLEYTMRNYSTFEEIKDEEFHRRRQAFIDAANAFEEYIDYEKYRE